MHPTRRAHLQQALHDEHVERRLEAVLALPRGGLVGLDVLPALVVDHQRHAAGFRQAGSDYEQHRDRQKSFVAET